MRDLPAGNDGAIRETTIVTVTQPAEGNIMALRSDSIANVSVAIMALAIAVFVGSQLLKPAPTASIGKPYKVGEQFDLAIQASFDKSSKTVVMFFQSQCRFCSDSMPFYRRLLAERTDGKAAFHLVAVSLDPLTIAKAYMEENGIEADELVRYPQTDKMRISGTPTLLVVDGEKRVIGTWMGKLTTEQEQAVGRALTVGRP